METGFGGFMGDTQVVSAIATLTYDCRRSDFFKPHLIGALKLVDNGSITAKTVGAKHGELGHTQFLPGNALRYGVDGNGDGRVDFYNVSRCAGVHGQYAAPERLEARKGLSGRRAELRCYQANGTRLQSISRPSPSWARGSTDDPWRPSGRSVVMRPDLIIFDCDGVLIDSEIISARMLVAALAERGVQIDLTYVSRHFLGRSYPVVMQTIRKDFGLDLPPEFEADYRERLLEGFRQGLTIMPGVRDVLERLALPWCVATSSSPRRAEMSLTLVGLWPLVEGRLFTASQVAHGKPAPDLFLHAAAADGRRARPAALVIEDSLTGLQAARAAGMQVWRFTGGSHMSAS